MSDDYKSTNDTLAMSEDLRWTPRVDAEVLDALTQSGALTTVTDYKVFQWLMAEAWAGARRGDAATIDVEGSYQTLAKMLGLENERAADDVRRSLGGMMQVRVSGWPDWEPGNLLLALEGPSNHGNQRQLRIVLFSPLTPDPGAY